MKLITKSKQSHSKGVNYGKMRKENNKKQKGEDMQKWCS